jgi:ParB-like chromosome segregation protein Spo0J
MPPRNTRTNHPSIAPQVEQMLAARSIDYDFEPNVRISEIRDAEGNQVRFREHRATKDQVQKYATAMKHGATFPAIVINDAHELIDGNTRRAAALKNGHDTIAAYICHGTTPLENRSLSVELNQSNGQSMTDAEIRAFIERAVLDGQHPEIKTLSRMTGVRETKIARWIAETQFRSRATKEGITDAHVEVLPDSTRAALNVARLAPVFKELTTLAAEARMPANDVKKVVTAVNSASSEADALAIVDNERQERSSELRAVASGFKPREHKSKGSAQHIGGLLRFKVEDLLDVAPEKQFEIYDRMKSLLDRLNQVVDRAEREWDLTPPEDDSETAVEPALAGAASA